MHALLLSLLLAAPADAPPALLRAPLTPPPRALAYEIEARLDAGRHQLQGKLRLRLKNSSRAPLRELRFHLYLNAFAGPDTRFMRRSRGRMRFSRADPRSPGWIKVASVTRGQRRLKHELRYDGTVLRVDLDRPLQPGARLQLVLQFTSQLPQVFARTGFAGDFMMLAQWYPRLGFLRGDGSWHCPPLHFCSEFFGAFADFRVILDLPREFFVGATGIQVRRQRHGDRQLLTFSAPAVHDFAAAVWPAFTELLADHGGVQLRVLSVPGRGQSHRIMGQVQGGLERLQRWMGPYPYTRLTVVDVPTRALGASAMEYPTLLTTWTPWWAPRGLHAMDVITLHELTHQYFQGLVASNEVRDPWLDEGVTTYVAGLLADEIHGRGRSMLDLGPLGLGYWQQERRRIAGRTSLPVARASTAFASWGAYGRTVYARAALLLRTVESLVGRQRMLAALGRYARRHAFAHPRTADLQRALVSAAPVARRTLVRDLLEAVLHSSAAVDYGLRCEPDRVRIVRRGQIPLPLVLTVKLASGASQRLEWDGREGGRSWDLPGLKSAGLGPAGRLGLDPTPLDDACQVASGAGPRRAGLRWALVGQALLQLLGP